MPGCSEAISGGLARNSDYSLAVVVFGEIGDLAEAAPSSACSARRSWSAASRSIPPFSKYDELPIRANT
jgi:hypothetical protein